MNLFHLITSRPVTRIPLVVIAAVMVAVFGYVASTLADDLQPPSEARSIKALLVTGGCCHDYDAQRVILTEGLSQRLGKMEWTICQYGTAKDSRAEIYDNPDWAMGYDLVVHNECFGAMQDSALVERIIEGHRREKVPAIFVHCSMHSYRTSSAAEAWREFVGVTSTFHEKSHRPLEVIPTATGTTSGLVEPLDGKWKTPNGELYVITKIWPGTNVLATAYSTEQKSDQPVIWTRDDQGVKVFGTTLGHHNETMRSEPWQQIVAAGAKWALGRE